MSDFLLFCSLPSLYSFILLINFSPFYDYYWIGSARIRIEKSQKLLLGRSSNSKSPLLFHLVSSFTEKSRLPSISCRLVLMLTAENLLENFPHFELVGLWRWCCMESSAGTNLIVENIDQMILLSSFLLEMAKKSVGGEKRIFFH